MNEVCDNLGALGIVDGTPGMQAAARGPITERNKAKASSRKHYKIYVCAGSERQGLGAVLRMSAHTSWLGEQPACSMSVLIGC